MLPLFSQHHIPNEKSEMLAYAKKGSWDLNELKSLLGSNSSRVGSLVKMRPTGDSFPLVVGRYVFKKNFFFNDIKLDCKY